MIRTHLVKALYENLLGPKMGSEELIEQPYTKYELGILNSSYRPADESQDPDQRLLHGTANPDLEEIPETNIEEGRHEENTAGFDHLRREVDTELNLKDGASSLGISFVLESKNNDEIQIPKFKVCLTWGRYTQNLEFGTNPKMFDRHPNYFVTDWMNADTDVLVELTNNVNGSIVTHRGVFFRTITEKIQNKWVVRVFLVNESEYDVKKFQREIDRVFQPQIRVIVDDASILGDLDSIYPENLHDDSDNNVKLDELLYRNLRTKSKGHLCAAVWKDVDPENSDSAIKQITWKDSEIVPEKIKTDFTCPDVRTEYLPLYSILQPNKKTQQFNAKDLSDTWNENDLRDSFASIENDYGEWIKLQQNNLEKEFKSKKITERVFNTGSENLNECIKSKNKILGGVDLLINDKKARAAFCFMNAVMNDKRICENNEDLNWREFQMAFILQSLVGVTGERPEERDIADVLWFPTGGGKTEAYLGIVIFALAYRRLSVNSSDTGLRNDGVGAISRYTLRLLTVQQFHRALGAIVLADIRRVRNWLPDSAKSGSEKIEEPVLLKKLTDGSFWGNHRFSLGLWIGNKITPKQFVTGYSRTNHKTLLNCEGSLLPQWDKKRKRSEATGDPDQISNCPICKNILCVSKDDARIDDFTKITWIVKLSKNSKILKNGITDQTVFEDQTIKIKTKPLLEIISATPDEFNYYRLTMEIKPRLNSVFLSRTLIDTWWRDCIKKELVVGDDNAEPLQSTSASMPGYFFLKHNEQIYDFEMFCTNQECQLNKFSWFEKLENKFDASIPEAFQIKNSNLSSSIPISAFLYDEKVYTKCPSFLIATVDKFANLPFEPQCASIFGNVDVIHPVFGYGRRSVIKSPLKKINGTGRQEIPPDELEDVFGFNPPSLILQDELHLIEGPLGSMMGIYELAVDVLTDNGLKPKYIASSATIKEAASQVGTIFRKKVSIFPKPGIDSFDNYFSKVEEDESCVEEKPGRLYLGMLSIKTSVYLPIQAQSIIMSEIFKMRNFTELYDLTPEEKKDIDLFTEPYWTFVSYFTDLSLLSKFTDYYKSNITKNVQNQSSVKILNSSIRENNQTLTSGLRVFPIFSDSDRSINSVSIFCTNAVGKIKIAIYKDGSPIGEKIFVSEYQSCHVGENIFTFNNNDNYSITNNEKIWISVINDDSTQFVSVNSTPSFFKLDSPQVPIDFPDTFENLLELQDNHIKIALNSPFRILTDKKNIQLSSETNSRDLVKHLEELDENGIVDSLQTSPVFGTGIDVTRLGLIQIMNQPKTNSGYIQSSGRVGRDNFGLVLTWLRAGRARDLNHYENFIGYHRMIHKFVEPITAAPFSEEALDLCLGPIMVSILRNARRVNQTPVGNHWIHNALSMSNRNSDSDVAAIRDALTIISQSDSIATFRTMPEQQFQNKFNESKARWHRLAADLETANDDLEYAERNPSVTPEKNVVLGTPAHKILDLEHVFENSVNSLRQTESTATFYGGQNTSVDIRPSQFITRYGPGTLLIGKESFVIPSVQSLIRDLSGVGNFASRNIQDKRALYKYEIFDSRMRRMLLRSNNDIPIENLKLFSLPTNDTLKIAADHNLYRCNDFPDWVICSDKIHTNVTILGKLEFDNNHGKYLKCPECQRRKNIPDSEISKNYIAPEHIIACKEGHLDDVPWILEIHGNTGNCPGNVFQIDTDSGNDNATYRCLGHWNNGDFIESTCDASVEYLELVQRSNRGQIACTYHIAETQREDQSGCLPTPNTQMSKAKLIRKTQMSIRMSLVSTSMEIKPKNAQLFTALEVLADSIALFLKNEKKYNPNKIITKYIFVKEYLEDNQDDLTLITNTLIRQVKSADDLVFNDVLEKIKISARTITPTLDELSEKQSFEEELNSLEVQTREPNEKDPIQFDTPWNLSFEAMAFQGVNVTQVQTGYSREISPPRDPTVNDHFVDDGKRTGTIISNTERYNDENDNRWYIGNQLKGEGIFLHLDPQKHPDANAIFEQSNFDDYTIWNGIYQDTLQRNDATIRRLNADSDRQEIDALENQNLQVNPIFVWWHSFAHEFINQLSIDSGFTGVSLGERIYCVRKEDGRFSAGIFIYASSPGTDGTLGGLTSLVNSSILPIIVKKTLRKITSCSNDPICSTSKINSQKRTGAACHVCLMNSETSCAYLNKFLDRNLVRGTLHG